MFLSSWGCWRKEYAYAENRFRMWWDPFHYHLSLMVSFYFRSQNGANNLDWQPRHIKEVIWFHKNNCAPSPACKIVQTFNLFIATHFVFFGCYTQKRKKQTKQKTPNLSIILLYSCLSEMSLSVFLMCIAIDFWFVKCW